MKRVLILGGTASAYLLGQKLKQEGVSEIYFSPGTGGTHILGVNKDFQSLKEIKKFVIEKNINLTIVSDYHWLNSNIVPLFRSAGLPILGPPRGSLELSTKRSKSKKFVDIVGIPQLAAEVVPACEPHTESITQRWGFSLAIKTDSAIEHNEVYLSYNEEEWQRALEKLYDQNFFSGSGKIIIEKVLRADEVTVLVACDKKSYKVIGTSQILTKLYDNDLGPVTKGMAACSPAPCVTEDIMGRIQDTIIQPYLENYKLKFKGFLSFKCLVLAGTCFLLSVNCHLSDIEATVLLPRLTSSLVELLEAIRKQKLPDIEVSLSSQTVTTAAKTLVKFHENIIVKGLKDCPFVKVIFGSCLYKNSAFMARPGGPILYISALGASLKESIDRLCNRLEIPNFCNEHYRRDISSQFLDSNSLEADISTLLMTES